VKIKNYKNLVIIRFLKASFFLPAKNRGEKIGGGDKNKNRGKNGGTKEQKKGHVPCLGRGKRPPSGGGDLGTPETGLRGLFLARVSRRGEKRFRWLNDFFWAGRASVAHREGRFHVFCVLFLVGGYVSLSFFFFFLKADLVGKSIVEPGRIGATNGRAPRKRGLVFLGSVLFFSWEGNKHMRKKQRPLAPPPWPCWLGPKHWRQVFWFLLFRGSI